jgi:SAM-dependent methyltransferase
VSDSALEQLVRSWRAEEQQPFTGWDFSHLNGRMYEDLPPWSYLTRAAELMDTSASALDMGTGGGERLLLLEEHWPKKVVVTEDYPPNVELASSRLGPLGVQVKVVELTADGVLPFEDDEFELVLNRHSGLNPSEVTRILARGGTFLTQQIDGRWAYDLAAIFGAEPLWPECSLATYHSLLSETGLAIVREQDWSGYLNFTDVGAIVYYLKAVPWTVPGFSVDTHIDALLELQRRLERGTGLRFWAGKFIIEAHKCVE